METKISNWLGAIPVRRYNDVRDDLMRLTGVTKQAFWFWYIGEREPSEINNIRIAYYAMKNDLPKYMGKDIVPSEELVPGDDGAMFIHAKVRVNGSTSKMEERYVVYNQ